MYAEQPIITPHPNKSQPEQGPQKLLEKLNLAQISNVLAAARELGPSEYDRSRAKSAETVAAEVNRALWYPTTEKGQNDFEALGVKDPVTLDDIHPNQAANCYGYTTVASELLDEVGAEHWIGYTSGPLSHAFILMPPSEGSEKRMHYIDPLLPSLNHELRKSIYRGNEHKLRDQIELSGRGAFMLNAEHFSSELVADYDELAKSHPWLTYKPHKQTFSSNHNSDKSKGDKNHLLVTTVYDSGTGRGVIDSFGRYEQSFLHGDYETATKWLQRMKGLYPKIDARQNHTELKVITDWLCRGDRREEALEVMEAYFEGISDISGDTRIPEAKADISYRIAWQTGDLALAETAEIIYIATAQRNRCFKERVESKIGRTKDLQAQLAQVAIG